VAEITKLKQDLEDTRLEVMTPEYIEFLNSKDKKGSEASGAKKDAPSPTDDDLKGLTPAQIYKKAADELKKVAQDEATKLREELSATSREQTQRDVAVFARSHTDYEQYRPIMYGMSLDPKNKDATLQELYDSAKEHVKRLHVGSTETQKDRSRKTGGEKPGSASMSVKKDVKLSAGQAADEAWDEVVGEGSLPPA
jgi:hypothetical protein